MKALLGDGAKKILSKSNVLRLLPYLKASSASIRIDGKNYKLSTIKHKSPHERA